MFEEGTGVEMQAISPVARIDEQLATNDDSVDDDALLEAARSDPRYFEAIYDRYVSPIYRFCYVRLGNREEAEDATSDAFLKALAGLNSYRGGNFAAWMYRIAHNAVVDRHRRHRRDVPIQTVESVIAGPLLLEERVRADEERAHLREQVLALPDGQRAAIELRLAGWSEQRTAEALGKTVAAVKKLRFRAVRRLRKAMTRSWGEEGEGDA